MATNWGYLRHLEADNTRAARLCAAGDMSGYEKNATCPAVLRKVTPEGIRQGKVIHRWFKKNSSKLKFENYRVSEFPRAVLTASLVIPDVPWKINHLLGELHPGVMQKMNPKQRREYLDRFSNGEPRKAPYHFRPGQGESFIDLEVRVRMAISSLPRSCLCVGHGRWIYVNDHIVMRGNNAWSMSSWKDADDMPNGKYIEFFNESSGAGPEDDGWLRREGFPLEDRLGEWEPIILPTYTGPELAELAVQVWARQNDG